MRFLRVWNTELIDTRLRLPHTVVKGASVYPFFRQTGEVKYLMLILPGTSRVFMVPYKKGIIRVGFRDTICMTLSSDQFKKATAFHADQLQGLFHYDTWQILSQERFAGYRARNIIMQTNCAAAVRAYTGKKIGHLRFTRDLSELESFALKARGLKTAGTIKAGKVLSSLAEAGQHKVLPAAECEDRQWVLDPVWQNRDSSGPFNWRWV